jgi:hypothetical protein
MKITSISTGEDGRSRFLIKDVMPIKVTDGQIRLSSPTACSSILIHEFDDRFANDWHNPPKPQYVIVLEGELQIQLEDTSSQNFKTGDIFLAEDVTGNGHRTIGIKAGKCLVVNLEQ